MAASLAHYDAFVIRRVTYLAAYAALAALGEALVARPALLWVRSQGILSPALAWGVRYGALLLACAALLAFFTFALASSVALGRTPGTPLHLAFLLAVGICFALRSASGDPHPPRDPSPALLDGVRAAVEELDRGYRGLYAPDAGQFSSALAPLAPPGFRRLGRPVPLHARILSGSDGPQLEPLPEDQPGTIYVAVSKDRQSAWLTAVGLEGIVRLPSAQPAVAVARRGTHSLPGADPALPAYPGR
jgi:hypothetical protein